MRPVVRIALAVVALFACLSPQAAAKRLCTPVCEVAKDLRLTAFGPGLLLVRSTSEWNGDTISANGLIVIGSRQVLIVDTPWTDAQTAVMLDWVEREIDLPVYRVVVTHAHNDRIGGIAEVHRRGILTLGHEDSVALAEAAGYEPPKITLSQEADLDLDGERVKVYYPGPAHAPDNLVVWMERRRLLYGGCLVKSRASRGLGYTADADGAGWRRSLVRLTESFADARVVIPGHGDPGGSELLEHTRTLLERSRETSQR